MAPGLSSQGVNTLVLTPAGLGLPVLHAAPVQALSEAVSCRRVALMSFAGHRDFPAGLVAAQLRHAKRAMAWFEVAAPRERTDSATIARAFDDLDMAAEWFDGARARLDGEPELLLVPAVLGLDRSEDVIRLAEERLGLAVREIATLPPCLPGMRLAAALERRVRGLGGVVRSGPVVRGVGRAGMIASAIDANGRGIAARAFVVATGGVLMGGLEVRSDGTVVEAALGLEVHDTAPLGALGCKATLTALHVTGIETDADFRAGDNVFVTGRTLAHHDPAGELSAEGVSIVTAWSAAEAAHAMLGA
jgi:glycerol-3-phosphate dehydrogenase subunit B